MDDDDLVTRAFNAYSSEHLISELIRLSDRYSEDFYEYPTLRLMIISYYGLELYDLKESLLKQGKPMPWEFPSLTESDVQVIFEMTHVDFLKWMEETFEDLKSFVEYCDTLKSIDDYVKGK